MGSGTGAPVWHLGSRGSQVAVIAALKLEADSLRRAATGAVFVSGPGLKAAARAASAAIEQGASALVSWGLAGGLQPAATPGSVVLPERILADGEVYEAEPGWHREFGAAIAGRFRVIGGALLSVDGVLTTPAAKADWRQRTGAVAVDMESVAVARLAASRGLPFLAVRVVADGADDALPDRVETLVSADGGTRLAGLLPILLEPRQLARLIRLGRRSRRARAVLRELAAGLAGRAP